MTYTSRICILAAAAVLFFTGCSDNGKQPKKYTLDPRNPRTVTIWHYYNGPQKRAFDDMVTQFNETIGYSEGIIVEAFSQGSISQLNQKLLDAAERKAGSSELPDMFASYADTAFEIDQLGYVASLDPYFTDKELEEYVSAYIDEGRFTADSKLKIFPVAKATELFMMNKTDWDVFAAATGASLSDLATWEGIAAVAEQYYKWTDSLTETPGDGQAFFGRDAYANHIITGMKQLGYDIFSTKNGTVTVNLDEKALKRIWDTFYVPYIRGYYTASGRFRSDDAKMGEIIALVCASSGAIYFPNKVTVDDKNSYPIDFIVCPVPVFKDAPPVAIQQGAGMVVVKSESEQEYAAVEFLKWFTEAKQNIVFAVGAGYLPVKQAAYDMEIIAEQLEKIDKESFEQYERALEVAVKQVKEYDLYTTKPFSGSIQARAVLEKALIDKAKNDREKISALKQSGVSAEDAEKAVNTEENFKEWRASLQSELQTIIGSAGT